MWQRGSTEALKLEVQVRSDIRPLGLHAGRFKFHRHDLDEVKEGLEGLDLTSETFEGRPIYPPHSGPTYRINAVLTAGPHTCRGLYLALVPI